MVLGPPLHASEAMTEVRYAQAELALLDQQPMEALRLLKENLKPGELHMPSYQLLINIYLSQGENAKAFKVMYFLVRRLHPVDGTRILGLGYVDNIREHLSEISPPRREALELYFMIAQQYYRLAEQGKFTNEYRAQLYELSAKYFLICDYYKYSLPQTNYFLGVVQSRRRQHQDAITRLIEAKELFAKDDFEGDKPSAQNINFLIADNLVREGYRDAGTLYLNSIYLEPEADESLRQYSKSYLDNLAANFSLISVGLSYNIRQNPYRFQDTFLENYTQFQEILGEKNGASVAKSAGYFFSSKRYGHMVYSFRANLREDLYNDSLHWRLDSRLLTGALELKYDNLRRSLLKVSYTHTHIMTRPDEDKDFKSSSTDHALNIEYVHTLKRGTLSYRLPLSLRERKNLEDLMTKGLGLSYVPFYRTRWLAPSFSLDYSLAEESDDVRDTRRLRGSISNHIRFSQIVSTFIFASYTQTSHAEERFSSNELSFNLYTNVLLRFIRNLSANFSVSRTLADTKDDDKISTLTLTTGLNYSF